MASARRSRATRSTRRAWMRAAWTGSIPAFSARSSRVSGGGPRAGGAGAGKKKAHPNPRGGWGEPYLLKIGFLAREPRGRRVTAEAYAHLGKPLPARPAGGQAGLFELSRRP